jgi:hypothetical protein
VLDEVRGTGDTTLQGYVDKWLNSEAARLVDAYDFPELMTRWYATLSTTAPTPQVWAPYELTAVPRDMVKLMNAHIIDTANTSSQPKRDLEVVPSFEFHRLISTVNPPTSGKPSRVCLRRIEGAAEHGYAPRTGTAGIRVLSSAGAAESATVNVGATYYADANRTDIRKAQTTASLASATPVAVTTDTVYGIISLSATGDSVGRLTFDNTAGTIVYAVTLPWERTASYMVLGFNVLPDLATYDFHATYKRSMQYLSQTSDTLQPLPSVVQDICMTRAKIRGLKMKEDADWKNLELEAQRLERLLIHSYNFQTLEEPRMVMY